MKNGNECGPDKLERNCKCFKSVRLRNEREIERAGSRVWVTKRDVYERRRGGGTVKLEDREGG